MTPKLFSELGLSAEVLKAIDKLGFEQAAPIQASAIPILMEGGDVVGQSQTGSGKTAAFAIPAIEKIDPKQRAVQVLILCPTRELAIQVSEEVHKLALYKTGVHALPIYGGQSFERQLVGLRHGANIVIGTPGRVMDHMRRGTLKLADVKMAVLDEVDVMLNMGFREDIEVILQAAPVERQTVFFSATIPRPIQQLIEKYSKSPQQVRIEQKALTVPTVEQVYYEIPRDRKIELLTRLIDIHDLKLGIIFCNTKRMVDDLVEHLNAQGYSADRLHGDMNQIQRDRVMNKFRKSGLEFLVATDVAARGIDVDDVQVVFNYDLPYDVEDYLHRIGRTGRAGRSGRAISFVAGREVFQIQNIERFTKVRIQRGKPPTAGQVEEARAVVFLDKLRALLTSGDFKKQDHIVERLLEEGFSSPDIASAAIHQLTGGEIAAPARAKQPERTEPPARAERAERAERPDRYAEQRPERDRAPRREAVRREERPRGPRDREDSRDPRSRSGRDDRGGPERSPARSYARGPERGPERGADRGPARSPERREGRREERGDDKRPSRPSTRPEPASQPFWKKKFSRDTREEKPPAASESGEKHKKSRRTPSEQTRLWMNVGESMGIQPIDVVNAVAGETGLPGKVVGTVDVRERHLFADVSKEHADAIIAKLNRSDLKGHKLKVKLA